MWFKLEVITVEEAPADGSDALEAMLGVFDEASEQKSSPMAEAPESTRAALMVEVANRLCHLTCLSVLLDGLTNEPVQVCNGHTFRMKSDKEYCLTLVKV